MAIAETIKVPILATPPTGRNDRIIDPALIVLIMQRSGTAYAGRWRGSAAAVWTGGAYAGPQLA
jgi:hypothetical protein